MFGKVLRFKAPKRKTPLDENTDLLERLAIDHHKAYEALRSVNRRIAEARIERSRIIDAERAKR
jgi:hypothetical protein